MRRGCSTFSATFVSCSSQSRRESWLPGLNWNGLCLSKHERLWVYLPVPPKAAHRCPVQTSVFGLHSTLLRVLRCWEAPLSGGKLQLGSPAQERSRAAEFCLESPRGLDATLASCPSQTWHSVDPPKEFRPGHWARLCWPHLRWAVGPKPARDGPAPLVWEVGEDQVSTAFLSFPLTPCWCSCEV